MPSPPGRTWTGSRPPWAWGRVSWRLGTPDLRFVAAVGWRQPWGKEKRGELRDLSQKPAPTADPAPAETPAAVVPPPDRDKDGIPDEKDRAPDEAEDKDEFQDEDGAPDPDNDGDSVLDKEDLCPLAPVAPGAAGVLGCPDPDGDGFVTRSDLCPDEAPRAEELASLSRGCAGKDTWARETVLYSGTKHNVLVYPGSIEFTTQDAITPASASALSAVAAWIQEHPRAARLEIAVHTDNMDLPEADRARRTQVRADAVLAWLASGGPPGQTAGAAAGTGIERGRLSARGYGVSEPLDSNGTSTGRARNRRVEIRIVEITPPRRGEK